MSSLHFGRRGCILADGWAALHREDPGTKQEHKNEPCHPRCEGNGGRELREWTEQCRKPIGKVDPRFQFPLRFEDPSAAEGDGGEHGDRGDDGDIRAREAILEVAAEQGHGGRGGGEDSSDRRLNGRSRGGEIYRDGDGDIDIVRRLRSMSTVNCKGQVNDQNGHVGGGHVEVEAREHAAAAIRYCWRSPARKKRPTRCPRGAGRAIQICH